MKSNARNASALILFALLTAGSSMAMATVRDASQALVRLAPSPRPSPPNVAEGEINAAHGGEGETRLLAQADTVKAAEFLAKSAAERTPEEKKRVKSAVVLLSVLSGIALSGLLLIIAAVSIRGLQRKLAGPTRLDREPADLFPPPPRPEPEMPPADTATPADASSQETRLT